jgi:bifunctional non-homologous end joining protein LigD
LAQERVQVNVGGHRLSLSNLDKVLYPEAGFTKGQVLDYYTRIADTLVPHMRDRPLTLKRYPNGVDGHFFYEKNCPKHRPSWVKTRKIDTGSKKIDFCVCQDLPTLVWVANLASLELHTSLSHARPIKRPTMMVFDLDPGPPAAILDCCRVGLMLRDALAGLGLESFPKTSGSKGLQVYVPLNDGEVTYDHTKPLSNALARHMESEHGDMVVSSQKKELRKGKVLIDWSQNDEHKTTVGVYSLRARDRPTVSTPVGWDEVEAALKNDDADALVFDAEQVLKRVEERGDLFEPVLSLEQGLPEL